MQDNLISFGKAFFDFRAFSPLLADDNRGFYGKAVFRKEDHVFPIALDDRGGGYCQYGWGRCIGFRLKAAIFPDVVVRIVSSMSWAHFTSQLG